MEDRRGGVSGNETLACFAVSARHSASGGFVKKFVCETLLEAGFASGSSPPSLEGGGRWEGKREGAKKRRTGQQSTESRRAAVVRRDGSQAFSR